MDQLILVRHGETLHNVAGIAQGWGDSALSPRGEQQVQRLAARLRTAGINALYSSPLQRALTTAQAIADATGLTIRTIDELREMNYGSWEGRSFLDVRRDDSEIYERWIADPEAPCPEGESHADVHRRLQRAFRLIEDDGRGWPSGGRMRPAIVTHGTSIRVSATVLLGLPVLASRHFAQDNAALNLFVTRGDRASGRYYVLKSWNDATHCHDAG